MIKYQCNYCGLLSDKPMESFEIAFRRYNEEPEKCIASVEIHLCGKECIDAAEKQTPYLIHYSEVG